MLWIVRRVVFIYFLINHLEGTHMTRLYTGIGYVVGLISVFLCFPRFIYFLVNSPHPPGQEPNPGSQAESRQRLYPWRASELWSEGGIGLWSEAGWDSGVRAEWDSGERAGWEKRICISLTARSPDTNVIVSQPNQDLSRSLYIMPGRLCRSWQGYRRQFVSYVQILRTVCFFFYFIVLLELRKRVLTQGMWCFNVVKASLRFKKLNFSINSRKLTIFSRFFFFQTEVKP